MSPDQILEIKALEERTRINPDDVNAWENLGDLYFSLDDRKNAAICYKRVLSINPNDVEVQVNLDRLNNGQLQAQAALEIKEYINPLNWLTYEIPLIFQVLLGLIGFLITLIIANLQNWQITDLVWSLWITSLTLGYTFLITSVVANAIRNGMQQSDDSPNGIGKYLPNDQLRWIFAIFGGLFTLMFFTVHFGLFHFVHSIFLNSFFPLVSSKQGDIPNVIFIIQKSISLYWPVILLSLITQIRNFQQIVNNPSQNQMMTPYKNVIKMHISILLFGFLSIKGFNEIFLPYLLIFYFFPFAAIADYFRRRKSTKLDAEAVE